MNHPIYIAHRSRVYKLRLHTSKTRCPDCTKNCAYRRHDDPTDKTAYCEKSCYLPNWFRQLEMPNAWLEVVK